jgi:hypothetical protein
VYVHVDMPGTVTEHNAGLREEGLPTWQLSPDADPVIFIQSRVLFGNGSTSSSDASSIIIWAVLAAGVILLAVVVGWVIWQSSRRRKRRRARSAYPDPVYPVNATWSDEIADVSSSYLEDGDGNLINVDEEMRPSQDYH